MGRGAAADLGAIRGEGGANQVKGGAERAVDEFDPAELSD